MLYNPIYILIYYFLVKPIYKNWNTYFYLNEFYLFYKLLISVNWSRYCTIQCMFIFLKLYYHRNWTTYFSRFIFCIIVHIRMDHILFAKLWIIFQVTNLLLLPTVFSAIFYHTSSRFIVEGFSIMIISSFCDICIFGNWFFMWLARLLCF